MKMNANIRSVHCFGFINGTKGNYHKFTINFYYTISSVLVNGNKVDIFERKLFEPICRQIQGACNKLNIMNVKISGAMTHLEDNDTGVGHKNVKEIDNNSQIDSTQTVNCMYNWIKLQAVKLLDVKNAKNGFILSVLGWISQRLMTFPRTSH